MRPLAPLAVVYVLAAALLVPGSPLAAEEPAPVAPSAAAPEQPAPAEPAPAAPPEDPAAAEPPPGAETSTDQDAEPPVAVEAPPADGAGERSAARERPAAKRVAAANAARAAKRKRAAPKARAAANGAVNIRDFEFAPATVSVNAGDSVTWTNRDSADHTATGQDFDSGTLSQGQSGSFRFSEAGSFSYVCSIHPNMRGTVQVAAAQAEEPAPESGEEPAPSPAPEPAAPSGGPSLPKTGGEEGWLAALGALLLVAGFAARRRTDAG